MLIIREWWWNSGNYVDIQGIREGILKKKIFFGHCPNNPSPQFGQLLQLFLDIKIQGLKANWGLKILYTIWYPVHKQPLKQFKVQIIGILEEIDSSNWPKMHLWKGDKKLGRAPHSLIWTKSKRTAVFFWKSSLSTNSNYQCAGIIECGVSFLQRSSKITWSHGHGWEKSERTDFHDFTSQEQEVRS